MADDSTLSFKFRADDIEEGALKDVKKHIDNIVNKQKELPKSVADWNKLLLNQKRIVKDLEVNIDHIKEKLNQAHQSSKSANADNAAALQKEISLLERKLSLRQRDFVKAKTTENAVELMVKSQTSSKSNTGGHFKPLEAFKEGGVEGLVSHGAAAAIGGGLAKKGGLAALGIPGIVAAIAAAIGWGAKKTVDWGWEKGAKARDYNITSQDLSYRYKLSKDLAQYTTAKQPGFMGFLSNEEMMQEFYPALGRNTGSVYLEKGRELIPQLARYKKEQGLTAEETAQTLNMAREAGFVNPRGNLKELTSETNMALSTLTQAVATGAGLGFDRSSRMEQLGKLIQIGNKDLGVIYKDTGKNIIAQFRTLENLGIRGLAGEKAIQAVDTSRQLFKDMSTPMYAAMVESGKIPDLSEQTIKRFQQLGETKEQARAHYYGLLPEQRYEAQKTTLLQSDEGLRVLKDLVKKPENLGQMALILGVNKGNQEQFDTLVAALRNPKLSDAEKQAKLEAMTGVEKPHVAENHLAEKSEYAKFLESQKELTVSNIALEKSVSAMTWVLKKELGIANWIEGKPAPAPGEMIPSHGPGQEMVTPKKQSIFDIDESKVDRSVPKGSLLDRLSKGAKGKKTETVPESSYRIMTGDELKETVKGWGKSVNKWFGLINKEAHAANIPAALPAAIMKQESSGNPRAKSWAGAQGLMQLMPKTAKAYGVTDPYDPEQNVKAGTRHISYLVKYYKGDIQKAIAAYNMGEGNLDKFLKKYGTLQAAQEGYIDKKGKPWKFPEETKDYLKQVNKNLNEIEKGGMTGTKLAMAPKEISKEKLEKVIERSNRVEIKNLKEKTEKIVSDKTKVQNNKESFITKVEKYISPTAVAGDSKLTKEKTQKVEKLFTTKEKVINNVPAPSQISNSQIEKVLKENNREKESFIERTLAEQTLKPVADSGKTGSNQPITIQNMQVNVPGFTVTPKGREQLRDVFEHELIPIPKSVGRN